MFDVDNVTEIRKYMMATLKTILEVGDRVYYEDSPPDGTTYPFIVVELFDSNADGASTEVFDMYINGWDNVSDTTVLESIMYQVNQLIDDTVHEVSGTSLSFRAVLDKKRIIRDADVRLKRREYRYSVRSIQRRI